MDYKNNIKNTYRIDFDLIEPTNDSAFIMQSTGEVELVDYENEHTGSFYDEVAYYFANYGNRNYQKAPTLILYYSHDTGEYYLYSASYVDFIITDSISCVGNYGLASLYHNEDHAPLEDLGYVYGYMQYNALNAFNSYIYSNQEVSFTSGNKVITDFYNLASYVDGSTNYPSGKNNFMAVRGENVSYNKYLIQYNFTQVNEMDISFGSPISDIANSEYSRGLGAGYADGYIDGVDSGFIQGQNSQGLEQVNATPFTYIGSAFNSVGNLLSIEILPNVTLGLCFAIPMTFVLIMTIFKLVRK